MLPEGERAPDFTLPGIEDTEIETYSLSGALADDRAVLLVFYPFDFSPVCTNELCAIRDAEWFQFTNGLDVWAISGDSIYAHEAFIEKYGLNFPLLSDFNAAVAENYGVRYDRWEDHEAVPKRSVFLIDPDGTVRYSWSTDEAYDKPDFAPVEAALQEVTTIDDSLDPAEVELDVDYD